MHSTRDDSSAVMVAGRLVSVIKASSPTSAPRPTTNGSAPAVPVDRLNEPCWITKPESASSPVENRTSPPWT
jgi:hypothetical protein